MKFTLVGYVKITDTNIFVARGKDSYYKAFPISTTADESKSTYGFFEFTVQLVKRSIGLVNEVNTVLSCVPLGSTRTYMRNIFASSVNNPIMTNHLLTLKMLVSDERA